MLVNHKWMSAVVAVIALCSVQVYAAETEETNEELSKIKALSKQADILAGAELTTAPELDTLSNLDMKPEKPVFEKPVIEKPKL